MKYLKWIVMLVVLWVCAGFAQGSEFYIIAHKDVQQDSLTVLELRKIYYGKISQWDGGTSVQPFMLSDKKLKVRFVEEMLGRSMQQFDSYWKQCIFTGEGIPPRELSNNTAMVEAVAGLPGAIGFVFSDGPPSGVRILHLKR